jgi:small-conductance mechanosensitive channel
LSGFLIISPSSFYSRSEINTLRRELKVLKQTQKDKELVFITKQVPKTPDDEQMTIAARRRVSTLAKPQTANPEDSRLIEMQREEIRRLKKKVAELEGQVNLMRPRTPKTPFSRERLTPIPTDSDPK